MAKTQGPSIGHQEALTHFLALGPNRTLAKLAKMLAEEMPGIDVPPKLDCLKRWSTKHNWVEEAERHDRNLLSKAKEKLLEEQVSQRIEWSKEFAKTGAQVLERVRGEAAKIEVKTTQDLATLANVAVICAREADALEGVKPQEIPAQAEAPADNVATAEFPQKQPAEMSDTQKLLAKLNAAVGDGPPN